LAISNPLTEVIGKNKTVSCWVIWNHINLCSQAKWKWYRWSTWCTLCKFQHISTYLWSDISGMQREGGRTGRRPRASKECN